MHGIEFLSRLTYLSRYSRPDKGVLSYAESVSYLLHNVFGERARCLYYKFGDSISDMVRRLCVFPSMRGIQFLDGVLTRNERLYNCAGILIRDLDAIWKTYYLLLCGCGVGFNISKQNVSSLPKLLPKHERQSGPPIVYDVEDSVYGWAQAANTLIMSMFPGNVLSGRRVVFDYSHITKKGTLLRSCGRPAPGPEPLKASLEAVRNYLLSLDRDRLKPIDVYDVICMLAQSVVAGGVRRSALIAVFDNDDDDMLTAKVGDWFSKAPWRSYCNNSAIMTADDYNDDIRRIVSKYRKMLGLVMEYGEPGVVHLPNVADYVVNPCAEIVFNPVIDGVSSYQFCNLTEVCVSNCLKHDIPLEDAVRLATAIGTVQASFTSFVCPVAEVLCRRDALLGVSLTGCFEYVSKHWNKLSTLKNIAYETNHVVSRYLGINPAARVTCIKPSGTVSCLAGCSSGIHPWYARRYIRNINLATTDLAYHVYCSVMGDDVGIPSQLVDGNVVCGFPIEIPAGERSWDDVTALGMLNTVFVVHREWVRNVRGLSNAVSCTILVDKDKDNLDDVARIIVNENKASLLHGNGFCVVGISFLPRSSKYYGLTMPFVPVTLGDEAQQHYNVLLERLAGVDQDAVDDAIRKAMSLGVCSLSDLNGGCDGEYCMISDRKQ